jgi:hypothetical protein
MIRAALTVSTWFFLTMLGITIGGPAGIVALYLLTGVR